jgi:glycosyltransferase involved in cell wall biosynthesis
MPPLPGLVTIVVPVYNVERYLPECISSILRQSYSNLEVIIVDDGSTDDSFLIAHQMSNEDSRIRLTKKSNGGLSSARNLGLDMAQGQFIAFIDSDDYIAPCFVEILLSALISQQADIAVCGRINFSDHLYREQFTFIQQSIWTAEEAASRMLSWNGIDGSVCDKLFYACSFKGLRFEANSLSEDLPVTASIISNSDKVVHVGQPLYYYRQRLGSITKSKYTGQRNSILKSSIKVKRIYDNAFPRLSSLSTGYVDRHILLLIYSFLGSSRIRREDMLAFSFVKRMYFKSFPRIIFASSAPGKALFLFLLLSLGQERLVGETYSYFYRLKVKLAEALN